jgi:hypothetical protein
LPSASITFQLTTFETQRLPGLNASWCGTLKTAWHLLHLNYMFQRRRHSIGAAMMHNGRFDPCLPRDKVLEDRSDESLIFDQRAGLTPSQMVDRKLIALLRDNPILDSHGAASIGPP